MSDKYTQPDLRQLMAEITNFPATQQTLESFFAHTSQLTRYSPATTTPPKYEPLQLVLSEPAGLSDGLLQFGCPDNSNVGGGSSASGAAAAAASPSAPFFRRNKLMDSEWCPYGNEVAGGSNGANSRWPRQETLTLLEIRSRLDSKFKESNQKGPLWDQVSRMMAEEYGYKRSGKKCKEKFDNLYKYYKKTKEGKAGRNDGKHYRFFRQLEAIYGECSDQLSSPVSESNFFRNCDAGSNLSPAKTAGKIHREAHEANSDHKVSAGSLSFSISSDFETSSSGNYHDDDLSAIAFMMNQRKKENPREDEKAKGQDRQMAGGEISWREEVEKMVDSKLNRLMETQETWMEKMMTSVDDGEKERITREEEWRKQEVARFDHEMHEFCARERSWLQAREAALMEIMKKFAGKE